MSDYPENPYDDAAADVPDEDVDAEVARFKRKQDGSAATPSEFQRLLDLLEDISTVYKIEGIGVWLYGRNKLIGDQRPIDLLRDGKIERVEQLVESLTTGAYV